MDKSTMNGNNDNDNDKYNNFNEMSLTSLLVRAQRNGKSSVPLQSLPISIGREMVNLQDAIDQALQLTSDSLSLDSSDTPAPRRSRRNHQNRSGNSPDSHSGSDASQ
jgi:hypothetical protein